MPLRDLGFTAAQEQLYVSILRNPAADREALQEASGMATDELESTLQGLVELGVIRLSPGIVVPAPAFALGQLIERLEEDLMAQYRRLSEVRTKIATLAIGFGSSHNPSSASSQMIETVEGMDAIRERIEELSFYTRSSLDSIQPGGPQSREAIEASRPLDKRAARRRIAMRLIQNDTVLEDEANRAHLRELIALGVQVRVTERPMERMLIFDNSIAVIPIEPGSSRRGALVIRQSSLVTGLADLFQQTWNQAREPELDPVVGASAEPPEEFSSTDRKVLALLASGATDETVARELGVSVRHLRRRVSRLMALLGAESRFGAGAEAARRGWI